MGKERDSYIIFNVPTGLVPRIRKLIHAQDWYDGMDMPTKKDEHVNKAGIVTGRISDDCKRFFSYLDSILKYES